MAKGPQEAGTEAQADEIFPLVKAQCEGIDPQAILEYGCGYGRMTRRLRGLFPDAQIMCVDMAIACIEAMQAQELPGVELVHGHRIPDRKGYIDLIFTCQVLQHITDEHIFHQAMKQFDKALRPGGVILMFENVFNTKADHMADRPAAEYADALGDGYDTAIVAELELSGQRHVLICGRKAADDGE